MKFKEKADYVVVGVGTAGAVIAKELSDDKRTSVIALHNGENLSDDPLIKYTQFALLTVLDGLIGPPFYINGETTSQINADCRKLLWALAIPEGGASSINAGAWCRGTDQLFQKWEQIAGKEWSVERVLEIYKRLENYHGTTPNPEFRGYNGPVDVRQNPKPTQVAIKLTNALAAAAGVQIVEDYNDPLYPIGCSPQVQYTQKGCEGELRVSSATAFLKGVHGSQLKIKYKATALRTIWKRKKAIGVEYLQDGVVKKVYAKKGVIVTAGLWSSAFLMHSGVGPRDELENLGIDVKFDNSNVGRGLADQPHVLMLFQTDPKDVPFHIFRFPENSLFDQISWLPAPLSTDNSRQLRLATTTPIPGITIGLFDLCQPQSRGKIFLKSRDPLVPPAIDPGEFTNSQDLDLYVQGFKTYIKKMAELLPPKYQLLLPDVETIDDTEALKEYIKQEVGPNQHWQCHCQIGKVVDNHGRVLGVKNLYVADNSIAPTPMDGSPMATGYLIAANVARMITEEK